MQTNEKPFDSFADLESDLEGSSHPVSDRVEQSLREDGLMEASRQIAERTLKSTTRQRVEVKCEACRGSGRWMSFSGYSSGQCFKCKGTGKILRAANYEQAKAKREEKKVRLQQEAKDAAASALAKWAGDNVDEYVWLVTKAPSFDFAASLLEALRKWGHLTDGQLAAVRKCVARDVERAAQKASTTTPALPQFPRIERLVRVDNMSLHLGHSKVVMFQSGAVAVVGPKFGTGTFGIIEQGGNLRRFKQMTDEVFATLQDVETRGLEAVKEIGRATGRCCCCGRTLTDPASIDAGIGPICAENMGGF